MREYFRPNLFANTPDILHEFLQTGGLPAFRIRLLLAATLGASYGIYSSFEIGENRPAAPGSEEYLHSEKYQFRHWAFDSPQQHQGPDSSGEHHPAHAARAAVKRHASAFI